MASIFNSKLKINKRQQQKCLSKWIYFSILFLVFSVMSVESSRVEAIVVFFIARTRTHSTAQRAVAELIHTILMEIYSACTFFLFLFSFFPHDSRPHLPPAFHLGKRSIRRREESFFNSHKHTHTRAREGICRFFTSPSVLVLRMVAASLLLYFRSFNVALETNFCATFKKYIFYYSRVFMSTLNPLPN